MSKEAKTGPLCFFFGKTTDGIEIVVDVPGDRESKPTEPFKVPQSILDNISAAPRKARAITRIDGLPVKVTRIEMSGLNHIEQVGLRYLHDGQVKERVYSREEFYKL